MKTTISAIQWMAFMIAGAIAAPIAIADLYHLIQLKHQPLLKELFLF
nr:purine/pyrimidine permease [Heyndrickxia sporothermodurans]